MVFNVWEHARDYNRNGVAKIRNQLAVQAFMNDISSPQE